MRARAIERGRDPLPWALFAAALTAASLLVAWGASPHARYLSHEYQPASAAGQAGAMGLFLVSWTLMIAAMMLPATLGLLRAFAMVTRRRVDRSKLALTVAIGFLATWLVVGYAFRVLDVAVHGIVDTSAWLQDRPRLIAASALAIAGAFQFSDLKRRCLTACRAPASFLYRHWHGTRPSRDALHIGAAYGASCVGCCWAVMLVLFGVGAGSLVWMVVIGGLMAIERLAPGVPHLSAALGGGLLTVAGWMAITA
jgi:predicted metal-binding membrane protein